MIKNVFWSELKSFATLKNANMQYLEPSPTTYEVFIVENGFMMSAIIDRTISNSDLLDFETNYKSSSNKPILAKSFPFSDASGFRFRGASFQGTCGANATTDIDYLISQERWINGGRALVNNIGPDDQITFEVVDKDNILGLGAGIVLDQFITGYYIPSDGNLEVKLVYPARIIAGLYLRLKYTSTHASGCTLKCNLYLHWKSI